MGWKLANDRLNSAEDSGTLKSESLWGRDRVDVIERLGVSEHIGDCE
jgi:hypothetical protein